MHKGREDKCVGKYGSGKEFTVSCQTSARRLTGVGRKAGRHGGKNGNGTAIWNIWYLDSTWTPPELQNQ